jgi:uncharacterized RDD family membrane protein YckC
MTTSALRHDYAGAISRTVAFLVDATIVTVFAVGATIVFQLMGSVIGVIGSTITQAGMVFVGSVPTIFAGYNFVFWGLTGRTPGMALLGLRVVNTSGQRIRWMSSLVRAILLTVFTIGAIWCLVDRRHQAIHDKVARTVVVRAEPTVPVPTAAAL